MKTSAQRQVKKFDEAKIMERYSRMRLNHAIVGQMTVHGGVYQLRIPREVVEYYGLGVDDWVKAVLVEAKRTVMEEGEV